MEILGKILGSPAKVKIMRLFLLNKTRVFKSVDVAKRSRVSADVARRELRLLASVNFLKKRGEDWVFNSTFKYTDEMEDLLVSTETLGSTDILDNFKNIGKMKLVIVSGIFLKDKDSRADLLIVGDKLKRGRIEDSLRKLEAEIGTELSYAVFDTKEFSYRLSMYDKLVRDILDFPHRVLLQSKELSLVAARQA